MTDLTPNNPPNEINSAGQGSSSAHRTVEQRMEDARVAIENAMTTPELLQLLSAYSYDQAALQAGRQLLSVVEVADRHQKKEYAEQYTATALRDEAWTTAREHYLELLALARVAFRKDRRAREILQLDGPREINLAKWTAMARSFYEQLKDHSVWVAALRKYNQGEQNIAMGLQLIDALDKAQNSQKKEKGEAQQATAERDNALEILEEWLQDFIEVARVALKSKPQLLESLGSLVKE